MSKPRLVHRCQSCGASHGRWAGRCSVCGEWNSLEEELVVDGPVGGARPAGPGARAEGNEGDCAPGRAERCRPQRPCAHADRYRRAGPGAGWWLVAGLGHPSRAESPARESRPSCSRRMAAMAATGRRCLLVAAEESAQQVRRRAGRLGTDVPGVFVVEATRLPQVEAAVASLAPDMVVVDSVQAVSDTEVDVTGGVHGPGASVLARSGGAGPGVARRPCPGRARDQRRGTGRPPGAGAPGGHGPRASKGTATPPLPGVAGR